MTASNVYSFPIRIYYEDTDAGGVVYYANYLKFMERARTEWLRSAGYEQDKLINEQHLIFAVKHVQIDYKRPARFNDEILVTTTIRKHSGVSIEFDQTIEKQQQQLCEATITIVCLDSDSFKPKRMPAAMLQELERVNSH